MTRWKPGRIRENPNEGTLFLLGVCAVSSEACGAAFDLFDTNHDGVISVTELCFVSRRMANDSGGPPLTLLAELDIFHALDVDGDAQITREEFCEVVSNPTVCSDEALYWIARWCESVDGMHVAGDDSLEALTATAGLVHGLQMARKTSSRRLLSSVDVSADVELNVELVALKVAAVDAAWYDVAGVFGPWTTRAYAVLLADDRELARSTVVDRTGKSSSVTWPSMRATARKLATMLDDLPTTLRVAVYAAQTDGPDKFLGATESFPLLQNLSPRVEVAIGPLLAYDNQGNLGAKIVGTQSWVPVGSGHFADGDLANCVCFSADACSFL